MSGINEDGNKITPSYSSGRYALYKRRLNSAPGFGTPDLKLTGRFQNTLKLIFSGSTIYTRSSAPYADNLTDRYKGILGLTQKNLAEVREAATREFINLIRK